MARRYPLSVTSERYLPEEYEGPVYIWDIDKTYLLTSFSSLHGLARIPLEFAVDKEAVPGMPEVLRGLRRGTGTGYDCVPLYFVSASPPQLRGVLENKMTMDGVEYDGITSKDWLRTLLQLRPRRLKEQVGFKICALLTGRLQRPLSTEYLFGDDVESDAVAFSLYSRLVSREIPGKQVGRMLSGAGVRSYDRLCIYRLLDELPERVGGVGGIFIHLEKGSPPEEVESAGESVVAVRGAFQLALALYAMGLVDEETVRQAKERIPSGRDAPGDFRELVEDATDRKLISRKELRGLELQG